MKKTIISILKNYKNIIFIGVTSFLIFVILRFLVVYQMLVDFYKLTDISLLRKWEVFSSYVFEDFSHLLLQEKITTVLLSILISINILLFILFSKRQRKVLSGKSFVGSLSGIFLGFFGVGCISCGAFILAPLITFLGLSSYIKYIVYYAGPLSFLGIIFILLSIIYLLYRLSKPLVCDTVK